VHDTLTYGLLVLCVAGAGLLAVQSHAVSQRIRIPAPALFLLAAACAVRFVPGLEQPSARTVERVVTVALLVILFEGGMGIGAARFRSAGSAVLGLGVLGTFGTVVGASVLAHEALGVSWYLAVLVATAIAPTDPAVVFSVLGQREVEGRSGTVLEGESGANDPVGIALMAALLSAGSLSGGALVHVAGTFLMQMVIGGVVGLVGGRLLLLLMRRVPVPGEGLYPVRTLVAAGILFGVATVAHGSGFLAVFLAGVVIGDERAPFKREIERFHSALASLAEIVAFAYLGFTVDLDVLLRSDVWVPGLVIGVLLAVLVRPVVALPILLPVRLSAGERAFVLFAGLKGAVPLLLGSLLLPLAGGDRLYGVVVVVVLVSVLVQGTLVPTVARLLHVGMRPVEPEPFALGMRLATEPAGERRLTVGTGSAADGRQIDELPGLAEGTWVSMVRRDGGLVPVRGHTRLLAGDEVLLLLDPEQDERDVAALFGSSRSGSSA
jgi:potassium/hydrogen antiporter